METLASKSAVRFSEGSIQVDPQLLFQRLTVVAPGGRYENPQAFFKFEMCSYPPALFDSSLFLRQANKPALADAIWTITKNSQNVLDGGGGGGGLSFTVSPDHVAFHVMQFSLYMSSM